MYIYTTAVLLYNMSAEGFWLTEDLLVRHTYSMSRDINDMSTLREFRIRDGSVLVRFSS